MVVMVGCFGGWSWLLLLFVFSVGVVGCCWWWLLFLVFVGGCCCCSLLLVGCCSLLFVVVGGGFCWWLLLLFTVGCLVCHDYHLQEPSHLNKTNINPTQFDPTI